MVLVLALGAPGMVLGILLAAGQTDPTPLDFTTYGISGAVIAALIFGWLWPKPGVDALRESARVANERADALASTIREDVLPVLREVAHATGPDGPLARIATIVERIERELPRRP